MKGGLLKFTYSTYDAVQLYPGGPRRIQYRIFFKNLSIVGPWPDQLPRRPPWLSSGRPRLRPPFFCEKKHGRPARGGWRRGGRGGRGLGGENPEAACIVVAYLRR